MNYELRILRKMIPLAPTHDEVWGCKMSTTLVPFDTLQFRTSSEGLILLDDTVSMETSWTDWKDIDIVEEDV